MALIQISCDTDGSLVGHWDHLPRDRPVVILLHGFQYAPGHGLSCPHHSLYAQQSQHPCARSRNWPDRMQVGNDQISAIGFGWQGRGSVWEAWRATETAGAALGRLISTLKCDAPHRPIHIIGHSMGVRVAMSALRQADPGCVDRVIALNAADFISHVELAVTQHARSVSLFNVTSRENALFDALVEWCLATHWFDGKAVGRGFDATCAVTLRLDQARHLSALRGLGYNLPAPERRICHWSTYLRPGTGALYRAILDGSLPFARLKSAVSVGAPMRDDPVRAAFA